MNDDDSDPSPTTPRVPWNEIPRLGRRLGSTGLGPVRLLRTQYSPETRMDPHQHEEASICFLLEGGFAESLAGRTHHCHPATVVMRPAGAIHGNQIGARGARTLTLVLSMDLGRAFTRPIVFSSLRALSHALLLQDRSERPGDASPDPLTVSREILALGISAERASNLGPRAAPPLWLCEVMRLLRDSPANTHSLASLAEVAGVHRVHLAQSFKRHTGRTVGQYLREIRAQCACESLAHGARSLSQIAGEAGFADQSHFTRVFKHYAGVTPGVFRRLAAQPTRGQSSPRGGNA